MLETRADDVQVFKLKNKYQRGNLKDMKVPIKYMKTEKVVFV